MAVATIEKHEPDTSGPTGTSDFGIAARARVPSSSAAGWVSANFGTPASEGQGEAMYQHFRELRDQWKDATQFESSVERMATHPAYQQIIGMGKPAIPFVLEQLRIEPDHWFWALRAISGENPAPTTTAFDAQVSAWLHWGRQHGYLD